VPPRSHADGATLAPRLAAAGSSPLRALMPDYRQVRWPFCADGGPLVGSDSGAPAVVEFRRASVDRSQRLRALAEQRGLLSGRRLRGVRTRSDTGLALDPSPLGVLLPSRGRRASHRLPSS